MQRQLDLSKHSPAYDRIFYPCPSESSVVPSRYPPSVLTSPSSIVKRGLQPRSSRKGLLSTYSDEVSLRRAPRPGRRPTAFPEYQLGGLGFRRAA